MHYVPYISEIVNGKVAKANGATFCSWVKIDKGIDADGATIVQPIACRGYCPEHAHTLLVVEWIIVAIFKAGIGQLRLEKSLI